LRIHRSVRGALLVAAVIGAAWIATAQQPKRVDNNALRRAAQNGDEWLTRGHDYAETYFSPLKQIDTGNVSRLGLAWSYDTETAQGALEATPLAANGTLYATGTWSVVFAVDVRTGKQKWRWDPEISRQSFVTDAKGIRVRNGPSVCCGPVNRGVALYQGKIYAGLLDGRLVALDAETGKVVWQVQTTNKEEDYSITGAPRVVKGKVIIGNAGADYGTRGYVTAYDAETGKQAWRFYTVPGDPSKPFENAAMERAAKTWTGAWWRFGGGGSVWDGMAYDPEADLLYIGTGNGGPWNQDVRSPKGGDNLYLSSIVALRPDTGEYVWHYQTTPGENWDYTAVQPMILADLNINGRQRKVIMQAPKNGFFYVIDRITGEFLSAQPYAKVTWATGVDQKTGRPIETPEARYGVEGALLSPSNGGAHNWHSMSWNPATGLVYIPGVDGSHMFVKDPNFGFLVGRYNTGVLTSRAMAEANKGKQAPAPVADGPVVPPGFLLAWDPAAQKERWRVRFSQGSTGGTFSTAGNLVFHGGPDGKFAAYSADKGEKLWEFQLAPGFANPVTYMLDGKQYVSIMAGRGGANAPGRVYAFVLDGKAALPAMTPPEKPQR
jgi:quinohemoprotein ethanol dehydrogenase